MFAVPEKILKQFGIHENMIVADLGAGTGFYTVPAGKIATMGKVYAIEIVQDMLTTIRHKVQDAGLKNVECLWGDIEKKGGTKLADGIIDRVICANVLFQVEHKENFIKEIKRILKSNGKVLLSDWSLDSSIASPKQSKIITKEKALAMFEAEGFALDREIEAGEHHYGIILVRKS